MHLQRVRVKGKLIWPAMVCARLSEYLRVALVRWGGLSVVDGDEYDDRRRDPVGVVVGLRAKGRAIGTVGFVRDVCPSAAPVCRPRDLTLAVDGV